MPKVLIILLILLSYLVNAQIIDDNSDEKALNKKLNSIKIKINKLKSRLNASYGKKTQLLEDLQKQDLAINLIAKSILSSNNQISSLRQLIKETKVTIRKDQLAIDQQKNKLAQLIKLKFYIAYDKTLKNLLINGKNKQNNNLNHQINFLQNKFYSITQQIINHQNTLILSNDKKQKLEQELQLKQQQLQNQNQKLLIKRDERLAVLQKLKKDINSDETESRRLTNNQKRLLKLIQEIKLLLSDLPVNLGNTKKFSSMKGKLNKPVNGNYIRSFRSRRSENTRWDGVVIKSTNGNKINAVAYGRVAYADWLRGFGMLIILDHQEGYMTLYGFNESLLVEVGSWVNKNQAIATVGASGTLDTPALYFEIRKDASPLNPKKWIKK